MILDKISQKTNWTKVDNQNRFRLRCSGEECSLSCANIASGRLSITSTHGNERHTNLLTKKDMLFVTLMYLNSLEKNDLDYVIRLFNKVSDDYTLSLKNEFSE